MKHNSAAEALARNGFNPRTTPVDTLMAGPLSMHLDVADAMEGDDTDEFATFDGFQIEDVQ